MSHKFLKVKIKSLAEEARIIRLEERRSRGPLRRDLADHRRGIVRRESRDTLLAYAYLRGRSLRAVEPSNRKDKRKPDWSSVERMVKRYGPPRHNVRFEDWRQGA